MDKIITSPFRWASYLIDLRSPFSLKMLGISTTQGEKDNSHQYESGCSDKSSLREVRLMSYQSDLSLSGILLYLLPKIKLKLVPSSSTVSLPQVIKHWVEYEKSVLTLKERYKGNCNVVFRLTRRDIRGVYS